jgi:hypothetical protein
MSHNEAKQYNCINCNDEFTATHKKYIHKQKCCSECFNQIELVFNCDYCNKIYTGTHKQINELNTKICYDCCQNDKIINYYIHNFNDNESIKKLLKIYDDIKYVNVTFKIINNIDNDIYDFDIDIDIDIDFISLNLPLYGSLMYYNDELIKNNDFIKLYSMNNGNNSITTIIDVKYV